ncbi:MAG: universal stress protein [Vicinamibacterales bacterium]
MACLEQLVVALASPEGDQSLVAYAAILARLGKTAEVRFVHVAEPSAPAGLLRGRMRDHVKAVFGETSASLECDVLHGALTDRLLAHVSEFQADLIVIGSRKHRLGARLAMLAPCAVAIVPNDFEPRLSHVLVPVDFSADTVQTLDWTTALVAGKDVRCSALHVMTHESMDLFGGEASEAQQQEAMRRLLAGTTKHAVTVEARLVGVSRTTDVGHSHPFSFPASIQGSDIAHTILTEATTTGADCIAMSTRGRSRSASILLGSVTDKVIERAAVPVLVAKHRGRNLGLASILLGRAGAQPGIRAN